MDVMFYETFEEESRCLERHLDSSLKAGFSANTIQEEGEEFPPAPLISIRAQSVVPASWAHRIKGLLSRSTGYDHLDAYRERAGNGLAMGYLPLYCHRAVAEQAVLLMMALLRRLPAQMEHFSRFDRAGLTGMEAKGKRVLVVGVGHVGTEICLICRALGMEVLGLDLVCDKPGIEYVSLDEGLARADVIIATMNLTALNRGYFDDALFQRARRGVLFVNVSRGELSPASVLLSHLRAGRLAGVALDAHDREWVLAPALRSGRPSDDQEVRATLALAQCANVILTPHNAFNTHEAVARKAEHSARQANHFFKEGRFLWPVPFE